MWLGGQTDKFQKCMGSEGVYDVLTFQKYRGARAHLGGGGAKALPNEALTFNIHTIDSFQIEQPLDLGAGNSNVYIRL